MVDHVLPIVSVSSILFLQMSAASAALSLSCFCIAIADMPCYDVLQSNFHRVRAPNPGEYQKQRCSIVSCPALDTAFGADLDLFNCQYRFYM